MPKVIERTVYSFDELSDSAKQRAIEDYARDLDNHWAECEIDYYKSEATVRGFYVSNVYWSGFWSQGDGASWNGSIDVAEWCEHKLAEHDKAGTVPEPWLQVLHALAKGRWCTDLSINTDYSNSCHEMTMDCDGMEFDIDPDPGVCVQEGILAGANATQLLESLEGMKELCDIREDLLEEARGYAREIYRALEKAYEHEVSEENVKEMSEANDWHYDEEGNLA